MLLLKFSSKDISIPGVKTVQAKPALECGGSSHRLPAVPHTGLVQSRLRIRFHFFATAMQTKDYGSSRSNGMKIRCGMPEVRPVKSRIHSSCAARLFRQAVDIPG